MCEFRDINDENRNDNYAWGDFLETPPSNAFFDGIVLDEFSTSSFQDIYMINQEEYEKLKPSNMQNIFPISEVIVPEIPKLISPSEGTFVSIPDFVADSIKFELMYNEIPSRSLQLANISFSASKDDLNYVFKNFGDVQMADFSKLSCGIATVQFYDMEAAQRMRVSTIFIRNKKVNLIFRPEDVIQDSKHPLNNGTIVLFHLPKNATDNDLFELFGKFGKIRQIRHTPYKESQRFIEYYDTRAAEEALEQLNGTLYDRRNPRSKIAIEFSLPGGFKKNVQKYYRSALPTIVRNHRPTCIA